MDGGEGNEQGDSGPGVQIQLCRFYSQGRHCHYGKKCRFLHVRSKEMKVSPDQLVATSSPGSNGAPLGHQTPRTSTSRTAPAAARRPCRYFLSGHCAMEDRCRFWHPPQLPPLGDQQPAEGDHARPAPRTVAANPPSGLQVVKLCEMTEEVAKQLRDTEIRQLKKRFPKDQLIIQEQSDGSLTYYRATVTATDPDWPFDLKEVDIMVSFPDCYPMEFHFGYTVGPGPATCHGEVNQSLHDIFSCFQSHLLLKVDDCGHVERASQEWIQAKHATNQLLGKVELLFRPFLRWLDRSLERLFTEGARRLKKDIDLEKAGLQFISYQELQATVCEKSGSEVSEPSAFSHEDTDTGLTDEEELKKPEGRTAEEREVELGEEGEEEEEVSHLVENIKISDPRRGTEVKLLGLRLGENTATVVAQQITVCLQCNRCKVTADLTLSGRSTCTAQCEKCSADISAAFRPCMLHHYSDVLGYLDLHNATPTDLVLQECELLVGCLSCSQEGPLQSVSYGQTKELNCEQCHGKLSVLAESTRFQYIQPRPNKTGQHTSTVHYKTIRDPAVQKGKPLPEKGTCKHYKQSHRWLRFPCCGRAYPCDVCHDEDQDHPMELATRMICGYCAKEQPYGNSKPCVSCGSMMTRGARTSHWEGGLGCRNKAKMCRNDRQKYSNINKTVSRKAATQKK